MFKFNRNDELNQTISKQKEQLQRYEARFRDLVQAYKSLQNEKEALEKSMKALTLDKQPSSKNSENKTESDLQTEDSENNSKCQSDANTSTDDPAQLKSQLLTLTLSLSTMSDEKNKIVMAFQAEKKRNKQEHESQRTIWKNEKASLEKKILENEEELLQLKTKMNEERTKFDKNESSSSLMLREIQKLLNEEKARSSSLQSQVKELKNKNKFFEKHINSNSDQKKLIQQLKDEMKDLEIKLKSAQMQADAPSPEVAVLKQEIREITNSRQSELEKEQMKMLELQQRLDDARKWDGSRISDLEEKILIFAEKLGASEKSRHQDQLLIRKLQERNVQIESENLHLKSLSVDADEKKSSTDSTPVPEDEDYKDAYLALQNQLVSLKKELEEQKAKSLLENMKGGYQNKMEEMKIKLMESREVISNLREKCHHLQQKLDHSTEQQKYLIDEEINRFEKRLMVIKEESKQQIEGMEREIRLQRDRTVHILVDKDKEIKALQARLGLRSGNEESFSTLRSTGSFDSTGESLNNFLQKKVEVKLLHNIEQIARKDVTINSIRKDKKTLEMQIRNLHEQLITRKAEYANEVEKLKYKLEDEDRSRSRQNANIEYLKNVIFQYLTTNEQTARDKMVIVIATILQFSPDEKSKVGVRC